MIQRLRAAKYPPRKVDFLEARLLLDRGALGRLRADGAGEGPPGLDRIAGPAEAGRLFHWLLLPPMSNQDRELEAYRRAVAIDPLFIAGPPSGIAEVYLATGKLNDAIDEYQEVVRTGRAGARRVIKLAHLLIVKNLSMSDRPIGTGMPWNRCSSAAAEVVPHVRSRCRCSRPRSSPARIMPTSRNKLLEKWRDENKERPEFWIALASLGGTAERVGQGGNAAQRCAAGHRRQSGAAAG